jgi:glycosyltransferase involved in cell wall biosynthesis
MNIGIGVTEHNRPEVYAKTMAEIKKYMPSGAKLVVVDDASDVPVIGATYRFESNVGIAVAKNKCLELLDDCDHIFLFDSDCYPICDDWWKPYVESSEPHLMYIFKDFATRPLNDTVELYRDSKIVAYSHPRGCMLYFKHICLDTIGGMDNRYKRWGNEHVDLSNRIFNSGLTTFRYADVVDSNKLIFSLDEHESVAGTVSMEEKRRYITATKVLVANSFNSRAYCEYKYKEPPKVRDTSDKKNVIITEFLTKFEDGQRHCNWQADYSQLNKLIQSLNGQEIVILHDCFHDVRDTETVKHVMVETAMNPYFNRWLICYQYLRDNPDIDNVWCVDGTDVEMLRNPFDYMEDDKLYLASENEIVGCQWVIQHHKVPSMQNFVMQHRSKKLLSAGLVGGSRQDVMDFIHDILAFYFDNKGNVGEFEMGAFNYVAYTKWSHRIIYGSQVNTVFKQYETNNTEAWWKHK